MQRQSLTERYDRLAARNVELTQIHLTTPSEIHVQTVQVLTRLLAMGQRFSTGQVPAPLRAMMRTLQKMEPVLIEELASVPPEAIRSFMAELGAEIATIVNAGEGHGRSNGAGGDAGDSVASSA